MIVLVTLLIFLVSVYMWPDTLYKIRGNLEQIRTMTGFLIGILLAVLLYKVL